MAGLDWLRSSRTSVLTVPGGVPRDALDTVERSLATAGFRVVSDVAATQSSDYRAAATTDRVVRFEPVQKPRRAEDVRTIVVRQQDERGLRVTVSFGRARGPRIAGATIAVLVAGAAIVGRDALLPLMGMLYYPLAVAIALLVMPGRINADAVRGIMSGMELALEAERTRTADSVRRRVAGPTQPGTGVRVAPEADEEDAPMAVAPADTRVGKRDGPGRQ